jgi:L-methionine (R)-S-oxide reductase
LEICRILHDRVAHYDWVGFYLTDLEDKLVLDAFVGDATEHTEIDFGQGICGQAADRKETFVVQDVSQENNYLSCSINVKSEIVVPIMKGEQVLGELDIDSHILCPFDDTDKEFLEKICEKLVCLF